MDQAEISAALAGASAADSRELDQICDVVAKDLIAQGEEPEFRLASADFATDVFLICSDRYWNHRFRAAPSVHTAAECARWLHDHADAEHLGEIREKWALGYAFITRHSVEAPTELGEASDEIIGADNSSGDLAYFATLYHAGKLRGNFHYDELRRFLESGRLAMAAGTEHHEDPLFVALQAFAAYGSDDITADSANELFRRAWHAPNRTRHVVDICLNGLDCGARFDGQGPMLRDHATEALASYPDDHMFHFRLASGHHRCGTDEQALKSINRALVLLPTNGRVSHNILQEQYRTKRDAIEEGIERTRWVAAQQELWESQEDENKELRETLRSSTVRTIEIVTLFTAAISFAVGSLQVTLAGNLSLEERLLILAVSGGGLLLFGLLIIAGTWFITTPRRPKR